MLRSRSLAVLGPPVLLAIALLGAAACTSLSPGSSRVDTINSATLDFRTGMPEAGVVQLIGEPDYASVKTFGGFSGGRISFAGVSADLPPVERWTGKVCRYECGWGRVFEVVYHRKDNGTWGLNNWEWDDE